MTKKTTDITFGESVLEDGEVAFEQQVANDQAVLEAELAAKGKISDPKPEPDTRIPKQRGCIKPIAFKKEVTDMCLDVLLQLNSKPVGSAVELDAGGGVKMKGTIDDTGNVLIIWSGVVALKD